MSSYMHMLKKDIEKAEPGSSDKYDFKSYSSDSTKQNFEEDYGSIPKSENERIKESREATRRFKGEHNKAKAKEEKIDSEVEGIIKEAGRKTKRELYSDKLLRKVGKTRYTKDEQAKILKDVTQKIRADRLAKKELRVAQYKDRIKRLKKADKEMAKYGRKLSKILNKKRAEETIQTHSWNVQQTGNILHTPNYFASRDAREHSFKTNNHILRAQNLVMPAKPIEKKPMKWL